MFSSLEADRVRLSDLEARIMDLERSLSTLRTEQVLVQERLDAYKYPVLTLPTELTSQIFIHLLPIYPAVPPLTGLDSPSSLTYVCRHWREVALATPVLWRAIKFDYSSEGIVLYEQLRHICDVWIKRSGSYLLSIDIDVDGQDHTIFTKPLVMAAARWEHLKLNGPASFLHQLGDVMPMLRSLDFNLFAVGSNICAFYDVPQLRTVVLTGSVISTVTLPWAQLTCLTLNYGDIDQCIQILVQALNVVQSRASSSEIVDLEDLLLAEHAAVCGGGIFPFFRCPFSLQARSGREFPWCRTHFCAGIIHIEIRVQATGSVRHRRRRDTQRFLASSLSVHLFHPSGLSDVMTS
ncbi:hypothetical protein B0H12DRAFT_276986 [Mycena haematopus]|nr:hypothetical protein B0H12DRAFT_276986 [Mycena haematopus]